MGKGSSRAAHELAWETGQVGCAGFAVRVRGKFRERNFRRGGTEIDFLLLRREWEVRKGDSRSLLPAPSFDEKALNDTERAQRERKGETWVFGPEKMERRPSRRVGYGLLPAQQLEI